MLMHVGNQNFVNLDKVVAICNYDSNPTRARVQHAQDNNKAIDATSGKKNKSVLFMSDGSVVLSSISAWTLKNRRVDSDAEECDE